MVFCRKLVKQIAELIPYIHFLLLYVITNASFLYNIRSIFSIGYPKEKKGEENLI